METTLTFHEGIELPEFAAFPLLGSTAATPPSWRPATSRSAGACPR
jgi:hypothetical protein